MNLTNKELLIDGFFLPDNMSSKSVADKYRYLKTRYEKGDTFILFNNNKVFGPFPRGSCPWDISVYEKMAKYDPEVANALNWVNKNIVINISCIDYRTLYVLIRIATGMLNKCNIPKDLQIMLHDNVVRNLKSAHNDCIMSDLPF